MPKEMNDFSLPQDCLLEADFDEIWIRDFATIRADRPVRFKYRPIHVTEAEAEKITKQFDAFLNATELRINHLSSMILDGGNMVDNMADMAAVTDRVTVEIQK